MASEEERASDGVKFERVWERPRAYRYEVADCGLRAAWNRYPGAVIGVAVVWVVSVMADREGVEPRETERTQDIHRVVVLQCDECGDPQAGCRDLACALLVRPYPCEEVVPVEHLVAERARADAVASKLETALAERDMYEQSLNRACEHMAEAERERDRLQRWLDCPHPAWDHESEECVECGAPPEVTRERDALKEALAEIKKSATNWRVVETLCDAALDPSARASSPDTKREFGGDER